MGTTMLAALSLWFFVVTCLCLLWLSYDGCYLSTFVVFVLGTSLLVEVLCEFLDIVMLLCYYYDYVFGDVLCLV